MIQLHFVGPDAQTCSCRQGANCPSAGKHPLNDGWQNTPAMSGADIQEVWGRRPLSNVGIATGQASGFWVLDIDTDKGGKAVLDDLIAEHGGPPATYTVKTGGGGWQFYFAMPDFDVRNSQDVKGHRGIDVRGTGGQVVAPPSVSGKGPYTVAKDLPIAEAPAWLLELVRKAAPTGPVVTADDLPKHEGMSPDEIARLDAYADRAVQANLDRLAELKVGMGPDYAGPPWNATTFEVACSLIELANSPWTKYTRQEAYADVFGGAPRDPGFTDDTVNRTFESAAARVGAKARAVPEGRPSFDFMDGPEVRVDPRLAAGATPTPPAERNSESGDHGKPSVATRLVRLAEERYELGQSTLGEPFALPRCGPRVPRMLRGGGESVRAELAAAFYDAHGKAASQSALADCLAVLSGKAAQVGSVPLPLRVAQHDGAIWLDLGDSTGRAIRLDGNGYSVEERVPVLFRRTSLTAALPIPQQGNLDELWGLVNVAAQDRPVLLAVLVASLIDDIPHPVVMVTGEQGSGKSVSCEIISSIVDPSPVPLRKPPRDVEAWTTAAAGSWSVTLDNVSTIPAWFSDSLCRAVTGDGDVQRRLYTNGDLFVVQFRRCVTLNGIDLSGVRDDLADRAVNLHFERLEGRRRDRAEVDGEWAAVHPQILGALLDLAVRVLAERPRVKLADPPRMADFARVLAAVDAVLGTDGMARYRSLASDIAADAVSGDPVLGAIEAVITSDWTGTASQLLERISDIFFEPDIGGTRKPREWPKNARVMTSTLRRRAPSLRLLGWTIEDLGRGGRDKQLRWRLVPPTK